MLHRGMRWGGRAQRLGRTTEVCFAARACGAGCAPDGVLGERLSPHGACVRRACRQLWSWSGGRSSCVTGQRRQFARLGQAERWRARRGPAARHGPSPIEICQSKPSRCSLSHPLARARGGGPGTHPLDCVSTSLPNPYPAPLQVCGLSCHLLRYPRW